MSEEVTNLIAALRSHAQWMRDEQTSPLSEGDALAIAVVLERFTTETREAQATVARWRHMAVLADRDDVEGWNSGDLMDMILDEKSGPQTAEHVLTVRANPEVTDERVQELFDLAGGHVVMSRGLQAVWRDGCDAGMVAP